MLYCVVGAILYSSLRFKKRRELQLRVIEKKFDSEKNEKIV